MDAYANGKSDGIIGIDKGVPMPRMGTKNRRYPWEEMKIGDSFLFPSTKSQSNAYNCAKAASLKTGWKFAVKKTPDGIRCWRTA